MSRLALNRGDHNEEKLNIVNSCRHPAAETFSRAVWICHKRWKSSIVLLIWAGGRDQRGKSDKSHRQSGY
jgi:hypothetical protein